MADALNWVDIPRESAKTHPLYGTSGWFSLIVLGQFLAPFVIGFALYEGSSRISYSNLSDVFAVLITVGAAVNVAFGAWSWVNLWLILNKYRVAVMSIVALLALSPTYSVVETLATKFIAQEFGYIISWQQIVNTGILITVGRSLVAAAIWIPYLLWSRRVNVTFLNRVRPDDPLAAASQFS